MEKRWFLHVKTHVMSDNKPDDLRKAHDQLLAIRAELEGVFDFRSIDRKVYDTRIAQQAQGIQALPQKVVIGRN
jgi:mediator of RNA polymerase II transcription subunit 18